MKTLLAAFWFNLLTDLAYPIENIAYIARKLITLGFLILFWVVISATNSSVFNYRQLISYFLISEAVQDLTLTSGFRFGRELQKFIAWGALSNSLVKPVNTLRFLCAAHLGTRTTAMLYSLVALGMGIAVYPPRTAVSILLFLISLVLTSIAGFGINVLIGSLGFYTPEARGIKNVYEHISKILSGALIPLNFFPAAIRTIAMFTPFPMLAYFPTSILQQGGLNTDTFFKLGLSVFWAGALSLVANLVWSHAIKNYDGVGI